MMFERSFRWVLAAAAPFVVWMMAPGCVPSSASYCMKVCACAGCDEADEEACVTALKTSQTNAVTRGCGAQYDAYLSCVDSIASCSGTTSATTCSAERAALESCAGVVTFGSPCVNVCIVRSNRCGGDLESCSSTCEYQDEQAERTGCATQYNALLSCQLKPEALCSGFESCPEPFQEYYQCMSDACNADPSKC